MRRVLALAVAALVGAALALVGAQARAATPGAAVDAAPGGYVPVSPARVVDTRTGAYGNQQGPIGAGRQMTALVTGADGVPTDAAAVAVSISVIAPAGTGVLTASTYGVARRPSVATVSFRAGQSTGDLAIVPVTNSRIDLWNASNGTANVTVDVSGYYVGGTVTDGGAFHAVTPARVADTATGVNHSHKGAVAAGRGVSPHITGLAGVPAGASAVAATISVIGAKTYGSVSALTTGGDTPPPLIQVLAGRVSTQFAILPLSPTGQISIVNHTKGSVRLAVDVTGYFAGGAADSAAITQAVESSTVATQTVGARATANIPVAGRGGVPKSGAMAAVVTLRIVGATATGSLKSSAGAAPTVVQFTKGATRSGVVIAPLDSDGRIALTNASTTASSVEVDIDGYVPGTAAPAASQVSTARYLDDLTGSESHDTTVMRSHGTADAQTAAGFVLLDVGTQSITAPLSKAQPGVSLARVATRVTLTDGELVDDVVAYLDAFETVTDGAPTTIAVGTNNDGVFDASAPDFYSAGARGSDWANDVIDTLRDAAPTGITVIGADDIESAFASTEAQALAWENAYLAATPAGLVYNGDANSCPRIPGVTGRTCAFGWTQAQYYQLAHNGGRVRALPQIFAGYEAVKWANIDATGGGGLDFLGSLTENAEDARTLTPTAGHTVLYRALSSITNTVDLPNAVDI